MTSIFVAAWFLLTVCLCIAQQSIQGSEAAGIKRGYASNLTDQDQSNSAKRSRIDASTVQASPIYTYEHGSYCTKFDLLNPAMFITHHYSRFPESINKLYFQTTQFDSFLFFNYAVHISQLLNLDVETHFVGGMAEYSRQLDTILDTIINLPLALRPYYLFIKKNHKNRQEYISDKGPFHFLVTTILYFGSGKHDSKKELLKPLVVNAFSRIKHHFSVEIQQCLQEAIVQLFGEVGQLIEKSRYIQNRLEFQTLGIIYHGMTQGPSEQVCEMFRKIWVPLRQEEMLHFNTRKAPNITPDLDCMKRTKLRMTGRAFLKLYQLQFLHLILSFDSSIEDFLTNYDKLKSNFGGCFIDFRFGLLQQEQLLQLELKLATLCVFLRAKDTLTDTQIQLLSRFLTELFQFVNFKYVIFMIDFVKEISKQQERSTVGVTHQASGLQTELENNILQQGQISTAWYAEIQSIMQEIHAIATSKQKIMLPSCLLLYDQLVGGEVICLIREIYPMLKVHFGIETGSSLDRNNPAFKWFLRLDGDLGFNGGVHSRFQYSFFSLLIENVLRSNEESDITSWIEFFLDKEIKRSAVPRGSVASKWPLEQKKMFLTYFKSFLTIQNQ